MKCFLSSLLFLSQLSLVVWGNANDECLVELPVEIDTAQVTVAYSFTAADDTALAALRTELEAMLVAIQAQEDGTLVAAAYVDETDQAFHIRETFRDAAALASHMENTVGPKFATLVQLATPSTFFVYGTVPADVQQAIATAGITAEFVPFTKGFERALPCCDKPDGQLQVRRVLHGGDDNDGECDPNDHVRQVPPLTEAVTVFYKWVPNDGKLDELKTKYDAVLATMESTEENTLAVHFFENANSFHVRNDFRDTDAAVFHLTETAANELQSLLTIATPEILIVQHGGTVAEITAYRLGAQALSLPAKFGQFAFGFDRPQVCCPDPDQLPDNPETSAATATATTLASSLSAVVVASALAL